MRAATTLLILGPITLFGCGGGDSSTAGAAAAPPPGNAVASAGEAPAAPAETGTPAGGANPFAAPPAGGNPFSATPPAPKSSGRPAATGSPEPKANTTESEAPTAVEPEPTALTKAPAKAEAPAAAVGLKPGSSWSVKPDAADFSPLGNARFSVAVPGLQANADARWERSRLRVVFPDLPSSAVGIGLNEKETDVREIWDIAENKKIGSVSKLGLEGSQLMALSPDGRYFAAKPQFDDFVRVLDVGADRVAKTLLLSGMRLDQIAFSGKDRLILAENGRLETYSIPDGKKLKEIAVENWTVRDGGYLSPGGAYLATVHRDGDDRNSVSLYDLATGEKAGELRLTADGGDCSGIAFSLDGKTLGALIDRDADSQLVTFNLADGSKQAEVTVPAAAMQLTEGYQGPMIEWLPNGTRVVIGGQAVIDSKTGVLASKLPGGSPYAIRTLSDRNYVAVDQTQLTVRRFGETAGAAAPLASGSPADAGGAATLPEATPPAGPPLTTADRSGARELSLKGGARWDVRLAAPPSYADKVDGNGIKIPGGMIERIVMSANDPPIAIVSYSSAALSGRGARSAKTWIEMIRLTNGETGNRIEFEMPVVATGVTPDAKQLVTVSADLLGRVDVWSLEDDHHIAGFRPADASSDELSPWFAELVDANHVLVAIGEELSLWKIPECRAVYTARIGSLRPALSSGHDHVAVSGPDGGIVILETLTGEIRGSLPIAEKPGEVAVASAFHHRGRWVAGLSAAPSGGELVVIDTATGNETVRARLPVSGETLQWCGDSYVLIDGTTLVSLAAESVVWNYELPRGLHCRETIDGLHWYVTCINPTDKSFVLYGASLPEGPAAKTIETSGIRPQIVFQAGDQLRLDVQSDAAAVAAEIRDNLTKRFADVGSTVTPGAGVIVSVRPFGSTIRTTAAAAESNASRPTVGGANPGGSAGLGLNLGPGVSSDSTAGLAKSAERMFKGHGNPTAGQGGAAGTAAAGHGAAGGHAVAAGGGASAPLSNVWTISVVAGGQTVWEAWLTADGQRAELHASEAAASQARSSNPAAVQMAIAAILAFEPPKYAFAPGAASGAGTSQLTVNGPQRPND